MKYTVRLLQVVEQQCPNHECPAIFCAIVRPAFYSAAFALSASLEVVIVRLQRGRRSRRWKLETCCSDNCTVYSPRQAWLKVSTIMIRTRQVWTAKIQIGFT